MSRLASYLCGERAGESVWAATETPAVSRRKHLLLLLCTINTTRVRSDLARSQPATGEIHYPCSHQPRTREQCCIVAAPLCSWTWSIVALTCCKPNNHSGTSKLLPNMDFPTWPHGLCSSEDAACKIGYCFLRYYHTHAG